MPDRHPTRTANCPVCGREFQQRIDDGRPRSCSRACARKRDWLTRERMERFVGPSGYVWRRVPPDYPGAVLRGGRQSAYILEHRYVMQESLGRALEPWERVHHRNGVRADNEPSNLELWHLKRKDPAGIRVADYHCPGCACFAEVPPGS